MTDPNLDAARAAIDRAEAEHEATVARLADTVATLAEVRDLHTATRAERDALLVRVAVLEAELAGTRSTVFGMSRPDSTPGTSLPVPLVRTYLGPGKQPANINADAGLRRAFAQADPDGGIVWLSIKDRAGDWFRSLLTDAATRYPSVRVLATSRHEPVEMWDAGQVDLYHQHQEAFEDILTDFPAVQGVTIWEGYHRPSKTPGYYDAMYRPGQLLGFDAYNPGIQTPAAYVDPAVIFDELCAYAASKGQDRIYVGETGSGVVPGDTGMGRLAWLERVAVHLRDRAVVVSWWNTGGCTLTLPEAEAWLDRP